MCLFTSTEKIIVPLCLCGNTCYATLCKKQRHIFAFQILMDLRSEIHKMNLKKLRDWNVHMTLGMIR